jgi:hypothetical protein
MVWVVKNSQKNGVLMDLEGIISEKLRCTNLYRAWDTGEQLLAKPNLHWKTGYSAKSLAHRVAEKSGEWWDEVSGSI